MGSIDKLLDEIMLTKQSMEVQNQTITEILNVSNCILLQMEELLKSHGPVEVTNLVRCRKKTVQALVDVVERLDQVVTDTSTPESPRSFNVMRSQNQRLEFLCSNIRKLLALFNTIESVSDSLLECEENEGEDGVIDVSSSSNS